jgi:pimeloyl-ACP methyl ester carboxylesterase
VIAEDLPGHGTRPRGEGLFSLAAAADHLEDRWVQYGCPAEVVLIGHSMGGSIATVLALRGRPWVRGLVVIDPAYGADEDEMRRAPVTGEDQEVRDLTDARQRMSTAFSPGASTALVERAARDLLASSAAVRAAWYRDVYLGNQGTPAWAGHEEAVRVLGLRRLPVLAFYPTEQRARTETAAAHLAAGTPGTPPVEVRIAPVASHFLHEEAPHWCGTQITAWIGTLTDLTSTTERSTNDDVHVHRVHPDHPVPAT